jgi:hypothetical protein
VSPDQVHWTARTRALVEPRRGTAPAPDPLDAAGAVSLLRSTLLERIEGLGKGLGKATSEARALTEAIIASTDADTVAWLGAPMALDVARAAALGIEGRGARIARWGGGGTTGPWSGEEVARAALEVWVARGGLSLAIERLVASLDWELLTDDDRTLWLEAREKWPEILPCPASGIWRELRARVAAADDGAYAQAVRTAVAARARGPLAVRCSLAYAFPDEPTWSAADAETVLAGEKAGDREPWLLGSLADARLAERLVPTLVSPYSALTHVYTLIDTVGPDAAGALDELRRRRGGGGANTLQQVLQALSIIESDRVARVFAENLDDVATLKAATKWFERHPARAVDALGKASSPMARDILARFESRSPASTRVDAPADPEVPRVLHDPPWKRRARPRPPRVVPGLEVPAGPERVRWSSGERERHRSGRLLPYWHSYYQDEKAAKAALAEARRTGGEASIGWLASLSDSDSLETWRTFPAAQYEEVESAHAHYVLARHELDALPGLCALAEVHLASVVEALARVEAPSVARAMARAYEELTRGRRVAARWMLAHPVAAASGLVPAAVGEAGPARRQAGSALRFMAAHGVRDAVVDAASAFGADAREAMEEVLAHDPYQDLPRKMPELPATFWSPARWSRPTLRASGRPLADAHLEALGTMLAFSPPDAPYPGLADVRNACDQASLREFAWALFESWTSAGMPARGEWAFHALAHLGDDETARRLAELVEPWSSSGRYGRAVTALRVLGRLGSDDALSAVQRISTKAKSRPLRKEAGRQLAEIAERRGLSAEQLGDRLAPEVDPDAPGDRTKRQLSALVKAEAKRLELALVAGRRWEADEFARVVVGHPLLRWLARRLVWAACDEGGSTTLFRVAEDRTFADASDSMVQLAAACQVRLVHPLEVEAAERRRWSSLLADYELDPPFPQMEREVFAATDEERAAKSIERHAGRKATARKVLGLESRGWSRLADGKDIMSFVKPLPFLDAEAVLPLDPGLFAGDLTVMGDQTLGAVAVQRCGSSGDPADCLTMAEAGPVVFSELVRDLESLR